MVIRFLEADASVERITAKVKDALSCEEPLTLTDSQGNEIVDSEGTRSKLYDQKLASNVVSNILNINVDFKGVIDCKTEFTLSQLNNDSSVGKMDIQ